MLFVTTFNVILSNRLQIIGSGVSDSLGTVLSVSEQTSMVTVQLDPETMATEGVRRPRYSDTVQVPVTRLQPVRSEVNIYGNMINIFNYCFIFLYPPQRS